MNNASVVQEYSNGSVKKFVTEAGYEFEAFIPNDCSNVTPIIMYEHGNNGYYSNWESYTEKFSSGECNSIVIRADRCDSMTLYNYIVDEYNLSESQRMTVSFSGGTIYAMQETAQMVEQNPNAATPIAVIMDGYVPVEYLKNNSVIDTFKDNEVLVLAFGQSNNSNNYVEHYKELAKTGVNVLILRDQSTYGDSHSGVNTSFMEGGLLEFTLGEKPLPNRYEIMVYDEVNNSFKILDYSQVSSLNAIYRYFNINNNGSFSNLLANTKYYELSSDSLEVQKYLNDIVGAIRQTNFLNMSFSSGGASTTQVPAAIPNVVGKYFNDVTKMLNNIVSLTDTIASIDPNYRKVDENLSKSFASELVDSAVNSVDDIVDFVEEIFSSDN